MGSEVIQGVHIQPLALEFQNERKDTVALKASGLPSFLTPPKTLYVSFLCFSSSMMQQEKYLKSSSLPWRDTSNNLST